MSHLTYMFSYRISAPEQTTQDTSTASKRSRFNTLTTRIQDSGETSMPIICASPKRFWIMSGISRSKVLLKTQWPDYNIIQNMLVRLYDTKRRVYVDPNLETQVNVAMQGPCFNCNGDHLSKNCRKYPSKCLKCGKIWHLAEFCDKIHQFTQNLSERINDRKEYPSRDLGINNYPSRN